MEIPPLFKEGYLKSLMSLWKVIAHECAIRCHTSALRDCKTVTQRTEHEGLSFLTITLPQFGKDTQKCLDQGAVVRDLYQGFSFSKDAHGKEEGLPRFLGGFLERVFDRSSGVLLDDPDIDAILSIRQLTLMFEKILIPCSDARVKEAMSGYIECEKEVKIADARLSEVDYSEFRRMSTILFGDMFSDMDQKVFERESLFPKHGPGATADKLRGNAKYRQSTWPSRLQEFFPREEFLVANSSFWDELDRVHLLEPGSEIPVRVTQVPKTLKTPRIIAIEPTAMMYAQQAMWRLFEDGIRANDKVRHIIGFRDQTPNQRMALKGSLLGTLATIDLSEASDRVSNQLVRVMLQDYPHLHGAVQACRSRKADVDGHGVIRLAKFASMGSALCFPIEAMVFTTLIFLGIEKQLNTSLDPERIKFFSGKVRVYGDDLIVPVNYVDSVVRMLSHFGAKVNTGKSFWTGRFRESCGREYYNGHDVSITRVRNTFPTHRKHATEVMSLVSLRNQLYFAGYWRTCAWLDDRIREVIKHFPVVLPTSPVHGRHSFLGFETQKLGSALHDPLVKGYVESSRSPDDPLDDHGALLKFFLERGEQPMFDERHLERAGRPHAVDIKLRWVSAV